MSRSAHVASTDVAAQDERRRFPRHAERAILKGDVDVFGGLADEGQLGIVDGHGAVGCDRRHEAIANEIAEHAREADLDNVTAHADEDRPPARNRRRRPRDEFA
jgi:hypothetical protein